MLIYLYKIPLSFIQIILVSKKLAHKAICKLTTIDFNKACPEGKQSEKARQRKIKRKPVM